jgi:hypothetical protein
MAQRSRTPPRKSKPSFWSTVPGLLTAIATLLTAVGGLLAGLAAAGVIGGSDDSKPSAAQATPEAAGTAPVPVVTRIVTDDETFFLRGFFTPTGMVVAPDQMPPGSRATAVWTEDGRERRAPMSVVTRSSFAPVVLLSVDGGQAPKVDYPIRDASSLKKWDLVEKFVSPDQTTPGSVARLMQVEQRDDLVTSLISSPGDAGAPVRDAQGRVVGMVLNRLARTGETESVTIEAIRGSFPEAF